MRQSSCSKAFPEVAGFPVERAVFSEMSARNTSSICIGTVSGLSGKVAALLFSGGSALFGQIADWHYSVYAAGRLGANVEGTDPGAGTSLGAGGSLGVFFTEHWAVEMEAWIPAYITDQACGPPVPAPPFLNTPGPCGPGQFRDLRGRIPPSLKPARKHAGCGVARDRSSRTGWCSARFCLHRPDGNVSATSPASHKAFLSNGSTARVSSKCSTKSNCSGNRAWK